MSKTNSRDERRAICAGCDQRQVTHDTPIIAAALRTDGVERCGACGCVLAILSAIPWSHCPKGKW